MAARGEAIETGGEAMPWHDGTGPRGRGPVTGRGSGLCKGTGRSSGFAEILGSLAVGLLSWGGQALSRRFMTGRTLPLSEMPSAIEASPNQPAIGSGDRTGELVELLERARSLEREMEAVRQRIQTLESHNARLSKS
jgi:hypothetical protein